MSRVAVLYRKRAALSAEIAALDLEIADALDDGDTGPTMPKKRRPRLLTLPVPMPALPEKKPSDEALRKADEDLSRLGYKPRSET